MSDKITLKEPGFVIEHQEMTNPENYIVTNPDLVTAVETAMTLGRPLLLTGEPGVGKSVFSRWVAHQLDFHWAKYAVKSTTEAKELFYHYDYLRHFHAANQARSKPDDAVANNVQSSALQYLSYNALGMAILYAMGREKAESLGFISPRMEKQYAQFTKLAAKPKRCVVLLDEIDKAPRDVPNDILVEIEEMEFHVPELNNNSRAVAGAQYRPVVIITSNSERDLPKPFLRRCVYYHIGLPDPDTITKILNQRIGARYRKDTRMLGQALRVFNYLREQMDENDKPRLSELLDWLNQLSTFGGHSREQPCRLVELAEHDAWFPTLITTMFKSREEQRRYREEYPDTDSRKQWLADMLKAHGED